MIGGNGQRMPNKTHLTALACLAACLRCVSSESAEEIPFAKFSDITKQAGIAFVRANGAYGDKLLPETMGGGVAFFDFDNDGAPALLFISPTDWPGHLPAAGKSATPALYHNDAQGRFSDVTAGSGLDASFYGMGVAIGDYDNDGLDDVFITAVGGNHLFHNDGKGKVGGVTAGAGEIGRASCRGRG